MEDELEEVKRDIQEAKVDLKRAQERGNEVLENQTSLNLLLEEKKRLTTVTTGNMGSFVPNTLSIQTYSQKKFS
jgi:hypothetical protein